MEIERLRHGIISSSRILLGKETEIGQSHSQRDRPRAASESLFLITIRGPSTLDPALSTKSPGCKRCGLTAEGPHEVCKEGLRLL